MCQEVKTNIDEFLNFAKYHTDDETLILRQASSHLVVESAVRANPPLGVLAPPDSTPRAVSSGQRNALPDFSYEKL
jgi:hypothetical protein